VKVVLRSDSRGSAASFGEKRQFFRRKLAKIAENCDHNIDPRGFCSVGCFTHDDIYFLYKKQKYFRAKTFIFVMITQTIYITSILYNTYLL
jgi:hypothetical protein